ncbi:stalk domain-containing protein [Paenibacillus sp. P36]|uniref:stalk domain-containing protein n=1 Tax=Paenibacillus sp. P36 TaxID=3342538 RepID=UPI0038B40E68
MKTWKKAMVITLAACILSIPSLASAEEMMMKKFDYSTVNTMTKDGTELAPLRQIAESLGFKVTWNEGARSVTLTKMMMEDKGMMDDKKKDDKAMMDDKTMKDNMMVGNTFVLQIDNKSVKVGDTDDMLMYAPSIINDMTYVPKTFIDTYLVK